SVRRGGGVAEILRRFLVLLGDLGLEVRWEVIEGPPPFFELTKSIHNGLQGQEVSIPDSMWELYRVTNEENARRLDLEADFVIVHDPQPAPLVEHRRPGGIWVWRCHIDASSPQRNVWRVLRDHVTRYDAAIFSLSQFYHRLSTPAFIINPAIDPLSEKNCAIAPQEVDAITERLGVPRDKPLLLQVSRFDRFKDPLGVIQAYQLVKKRLDCRLVLAGGTAADDPEGEEVLAQVREAARGDPDIHILLLPPTAHREINALQRAADVVIQKSTREGFGLTVSEAMWKGKPVVAGHAGGLILQVVYGRTGYTVTSVEGCAYRIQLLLNHPRRRRELGYFAQEHVRARFLVTRLLADYMALLRMLEQRRRRPRAVGGPWPGPSPTS
ncbi:MAG: glycosyltransferase, partial [Nitrospinota bacterium]